MNNAAIEDRIRDVAVRSAEKQGLELVNVEFTGSGKGAALRIFIDKPEGVTHEDCSRISQDIESVLDASDMINGGYMLEVSSPGIERGLYKLDDFERFAGSLAKLRTHKAIAGQRNFRGRLKGVEDGEIMLEDRSSGPVRIPWEMISKANLEFDLENELKEAKKRRS